jgi:hypothetical protein
MWFGGAHVFAAPGQGKSVLLNWWGIRFLRMGGAWVCNNTIDRVRIYDLLRRRGLDHREAREAVTARLGMWKSYDDLVALARFPEQRGDRGLLITLDEADMEFGRKSRLPAQVKPVFAQSRKFGISFIAATQGADDLEQYVLDRTHVSWRAEKWSASMLGGFVHGWLAIAAAVARRPHVPHLFRYKKERMLGKSTWGQSRDTLGRSQLFSFLAPGVDELACFNTHEYLQSAEADRENAENRVKWFKALLKGETVPVSTCPACEGTTKALQRLRVGGAVELVEGRWSSHVRGEWETISSREIFAAMEEGSALRWVECSVCGGRGYLEDADHPVLREARSYAERFGWRL